MSGKQKLGNLLHKMAPKGKGKARNNKNNNSAPQAAASASSTSQGQASKPVGATVRQPEAVSSNAPAAVQQPVAGKTPQEQDSQKAVRAVQQQDSSGGILRQAESDKASEENLPAQGVSYEGAVEEKPDVGVQEQEDSSRAAISSPLAEGVIYKDVVNTEGGGGAPGSDIQKQAVRAVPEERAPQLQGSEESAELVSSAAGLEVDDKGGTTGPMLEESSGQMPSGDRELASSFPETSTGNGNGRLAGAAADTGSGQEVPVQDNMRAEGGPGQTLHDGQPLLGVNAPDVSLPPVPEQASRAAPETGSPVEPPPLAAVGSAPVPAAALMPDMSGAGPLSEEEVVKLPTGTEALAAAGLQSSPQPPDADVSAQDAGLARASAVGGAVGLDGAAPAAVEEEDGGWVLVPDAPRAADAPPGTAGLLAEGGLKVQAASAGGHGLSWPSWPWLLLLVPATPVLLLLAGPLVLFCIVLAGVSTVARGRSKLVQLPPNKAKRVRLPSGLHLAVDESGVPAEQARHTILYLHGTPGSRGPLPGASPALLEEFGVRVVSYDRPGMGQSDYFPGAAASLRTSARHMAELADALGLGPRFWVLGYSGGGPHAWAAARYIPDRLAGLAQWAPEGRPWWDSLRRRPAAYRAVWREMPSVCKQRYIGTQLLVAVLPPWLVGALVPPALARWLLLPFARKEVIVSLLATYVGPRDRKKLAEEGPMLEAVVRESLRQGNVRAIYEDLATPAIPWEFDITDLAQFHRPIHIWQGSDDCDVPLSLNRYVAEVLPKATLHVLECEGHYSAFVANEDFHREFFTTLFGPPQGPLPSSK